MLLPCLALDRRMECLFPSAALTSYCVLSAFKQHGFMRSSSRAEIQYEAPGVGKIFVFSRSSKGKCAFPFPNLEGNALAYRPLLYVSGQKPQGKCFRHQTR